MWYYAPMSDKSNEPVRITRAKFKKIYGFAYKKSDYGVRFEDAHCINDPYAEEISNEIIPIVESNSNDMWELHNDYVAEI